MKKFLLLSALIFIGSLPAAVPSAAKVSRSYHLHHKVYGKGEYYQISCGKYGYLIYFQWVKPTQTQEEKVLIGLPEPNFWSGFNRRGMFNLIVNDISVFDIEPKKISLFNEKNKAGIDVLYNFDGVWMNLRFFMDGNSPLLHVECVRNPRTQKAVKSIALNMSLAPVIDGQKRNSYKREIITPVSVYNRSGWQNLKKEDSCFFMYDANYEGSVNKPKSNGPAYMKMDSSVWQSARMYYGKVANVSFQFKIKPDTQKIAFSLLELKTKSTNRQFSEFLKKHNLLQKESK